MATGALITLPCLSIFVIQNVVVNISAILAAIVTTLRVCVQMGINLEQMDSTVRVRTVTGSS